MTADPSKFIHIAGKKIEYFFVGAHRSNAPTLVFLHEGLGSARHWKDFPHEIVEKTGYQALIYSRLGYGRSDPFTLPRPIDYLESEGLIFFPQLLAALEIVDCILIGHSDGGSIALIFGGSGQTAVTIRGIVAIAAHVFNQAQLVANIHQVREPFEKGEMRQKLAKYHDHVDLVFWGWFETWISEPFRSFNIERYLPQITVPLLILQGTDDPFSTMQQVESIAGKSGGETKVALLEACEHTPHKEQRQKTVALICDFLRNL